MKKTHRTVKSHKVEARFESGRAGAPTSQEAVAFFQAIEVEVEDMEKRLGRLAEHIKAVRGVIACLVPGEKIPERIPEGTVKNISTRFESSHLQAALGEAFERGEHLSAKILRQPDMLNATDFAANFNLSRETVRQKTHDHKVLALPGPKQGYRYPAWQVTSDGQLLPELPKLFELLGGNPWTVYRFLLQHHPELDGATALEALKSGKVEEVLAAARNAGLAFS
jgi:hypothetical protein